MKTSKKMVYAMMSVACVMFFVLSSLSSAYITVRETSDLKEPPGDITLDVIVMPWEGGNVVIIPDKEEYDYGEIVTLIASENYGWSFSEWTGDIIGTNFQVTIVMDEDKTVYAHFTEDQYELLINIDGGGSVIKDPDQTTYTYGQVVTLTAVANPGRVFDHWGVDLSGSMNT